MIVLIFYIDLLLLFVFPYHNMIFCLVVKMTNKLVPVDIARTHPYFDRESPH